jgi:tRNA threonylcarbamoyladenosine biosynthesis protein TsaE
VLFAVSGNKLLYSTVIYGIILGVDDKERSRNVSTTTYESTTVEQTEEIGAELARKVLALHKPCFIALNGDLGAGKTAFVRGFASVLSPGSRVKSPSYTIVNEYRRGEIPVYHFDFYRLEDEDGLDSVGFDEYLASGICICEWCEKIDTVRPSDAITVIIEKNGDTARRICIDNPLDGKGSEAC